MKLYVAIIIVVSVYLGWLIRPAMMHQLKGTFQVHQRPADYDTLQRLLMKDTAYARVLWIPTLQRFGYYSNNHPAVLASDFFHEGNVDRIIDLLNQAQTEQKLQEASVRYVVIPYDSVGEIFVEDRKYSERDRAKTIKEIRKIPWLTEIKGFGNIVVFETQNYKDHFWIAPITNQNYPAGDTVSYKMVNPTKYMVRLKNVKKGDVLVFSERFDKHWFATVDIDMKASDPGIESKKYHGGFNSFVLPEGGSYTVEVYYEPQRWVNRGMLISLAAVVSIVLLLILVRRLKVIQ
jgi:hypothetical protein